MKILKTAEQIPHSPEMAENKGALTFSAMLCTEPAAQTASSQLHFCSVKHLKQKLRCFAGTNQQTKSNALEERKYVGFGKHGGYYTKVNCSQNSPKI